MPRKGKGAKIEKQAKKAEQGAKKAAKKAKKYANAVPGSVRRFRLAPCSDGYARALVDPWSDDSMGVCLPDFPSYPSKKFRTVVRGNGATGTVSPYTGFVWGAPELFVANDTFTGANFKMWSTSGAYAGSPGAFTPGVATGVIGVLNAGAPYSSSQLDFTRAYRLVAFGIRVRYTGTLANAGGMVAGICEPSHGSLSGMNWTTLRSFGYIREFPFGEEWVGVTYTPYATTDYQYLPYASRLGTGYMGVMIQSPVTAATFDFEIVAHYEVFGQAINDGTRDTIDPVGYAAVLDIAQDVSASTATLAEPGYLAMVKNKLVNAASEAAGAMVGLAKDAVVAGARQQFIDAMAGPSVSNSYSGVIERR